MAKRQGHGREKPKTHWCVKHGWLPSFLKIPVQTRKKNESRRIIVKASTKNKKQVTHVNLKLERVLEDVFKHAWRWRWRSNPAWKVIDFFWMLGNTWLELTKRSNLKNTLLVIFFKSFRSPRNQPPFKRKQEKTFGFKKKRRLNQHSSFFLPMFHALQNNATLVLIQPLVFFSPHPVKRNSLVSTFGVMYLGKAIPAIKEPSWDLWDHHGTCGTIQLLKGNGTEPFFFCSTVSKCSSHQIRLMFLKVRPGFPGLLEVHFSLRF